MECSPVLPSPLAIVDREPRRGELVGGRRGGNASLRCVTESSHRPGSGIDDGQPRSPPRGGKMRRLTGEWHRWWWRRRPQWRSDDGRWAIRLHKVDKWRTLWVIYDRQLRGPSGPVGFATATGAKNYLERHHPRGQHGRWHGGWWRFRPQWRSDDGRWAIRSRLVDRRRGQVRRLWSIRDRQLREWAGPVGFATVADARDYLEQHYLGGQDGNDS